MMIFQNPGEIDIAAVTTMGVSVKDEGAIGFFGTGIKFAIATILRNGGSITIYSGETAYHMGTERGEVRGEPFDFVTMNGERIGFTAQLGRTWEPWMAFRELASNCRDEGGEYFLDGEKPWETKKGATTIFVTCEAMQDVWPERHTVMLESKPIYENDVMEIHAGRSQYVYYRGVRVIKAPRPLAFTYNIKTRIDLTEDRTAKNWYYVELLIEQGTARCEEERITRAILTCGEEFQEHHMKVPDFAVPNETYRKVAREITLGAANNPNANPAAVSMARDFAVKDMKPGDSIPLSLTQKNMLQRSKEMLIAAGFDIDSTPVIVCETLGPNIHGLARDGSIFITGKPFEKGTREVAATLLEEYAHIKSGEKDCTRGFQNWLFDQLLCRIETFCGEPF
jgi:hypothetical protein